MHDFWGVSAQCAACKDRREPCASSQTPFLSLSLCACPSARGAPRHAHPMPLTSSPPCGSYAEGDSGSDPARAEQRLSKCLWTQISLQP